MEGSSEDNPEEQGWGLGRLLAHARAQDPSAYALIIGGWKKRRAPHTGRSFPTGTNKHFLCATQGPLVERRPIKIQCPVHCIIIAAALQTLLPNLLIATRPYLCLQTPLHPKRPPARRPPPTAQMTRTRDVFSPGRKSAFPFES